MSIWQSIKEAYGFSTPAKTEDRALEYSVSDPELAKWLGLNYDDPNLPVTEHSAMGFAAWYRAVSIIAQTIASLPLKSYRKTGDDDREQVKSFLDNPAPGFLTPFQWKEIVMVHLLNQGEVYLQHLRNNAGQLYGLIPVHRNQVNEVTFDGTIKRFKVQDGDKVRDFDSTNMTQITGISFDGLRGVKPITLFRRSVRLALAGERAATRSMTSGLLISGVVTPDGPIDKEEALELKEQIKANAGGVEHAGDIVMASQSLKFTPWSFSNEDSQFMELREFQVEEVARFFGIPPHLLSAIDKQTSWGTGIAEQNLGLARYTLQPWTARLEESLSQLLPQPRFAEFDYKGLLAGTPKDEIELLIEQVQAGLLTSDEARQILNRPPLPKSTQQPNNSPQGTQSDKGGDSQGDLPKN